MIKMLNKGMMSSGKTGYSTPKEFYDALNRKYKFNFDPCPLKPKFDGLNVNWKSRNFVNPPYGSQTTEWVKKSVIECSKGRLVVMLLPARTDTKWFHNYVLPYAREIWFIKGRLTFDNLKQAAPFPSMIVVFRNYPRSGSVPVVIKSVDSKLSGVRSHQKS